MWYDLFEYYQTHVDTFWTQVATHIFLSYGVGILAAVIGIPLGIVCAYIPKISKYITGFVNTLRVIPSLALMIIMIPLIGIGKIPAMIALLIIAIPPILINTTVGFLSVDETITEAAVGMGMDKRQVFFQVKLPLAFPIIYTGIRTSIVETIATATIATYIGAGGLGNLVFAGLGTYKTYLVVLGGLSIAVISMVSDYLLGMIQKALTKRYNYNS